MKSDHLIAIARTVEGRLSISLGDGEFPMELTLDRLAASGFEVVTMSPARIIPFEPNGPRAGEFHVPDHYIVFRKRRVAQQESSASLNG